MNQASPRRKILFGLLVFSLLGAAIAALFLLLRTKPPCGSLRVRVVNAYTTSPIAGVTVLVPGEKAAGITDAGGWVLLTGVEVRENGSREALLHQSWGETTLLAFKEGYLPYVLYYAHVKENSLRQGPTLYLFPDGEEGVEIVTVVESPEDDWTRELVAQYRPAPQPR